MRALVALAIVLVAGTAAAQPGQPKKCPPGQTKTVEGCIYDMDKVQIDGRLRGVQLIYFLERASEELDRAALPRRSFIPEMIRTLDEGGL